MSHTAKFETARLAGFSDGVFAICITLLVLELKLPDAPDKDFVVMLGETWPKIESWALSFLVIGGLWVLQHNIFALLRATDTVLLWLNLGFLMCISLMPWTTDLIGFYQGEPLALAFFSVMLGVAGLFMLAGWVYAVREGQLIATHVESHQHATITLLILRIPIVAAISIGLAFVHRSLGMWSWLLVSLLGAVIRRHHRVHAQPLGKAVVLNKQSSSTASSIQVLL